MGKPEEEIEKRGRDLEDWNREISELRLTDRKWVGNMIKKLKVAADKGRFMELDLRIRSLGLDKIFVFFSSRIFDGLTISSVPYL